MAEDSCELCPERIKPGEPKELVAIGGGYAYVHSACYQKMARERSERIHSTSKEVDDAN